MIRIAYDWFSDDAHKWRSWLGHSLLVIGIAYPFGVLVAVFCYFYREVEQAVVKYANGFEQDWSDNLLDIVVPMFALGLVATVFGWR